MAGLFLPNRFAQQPQYNTPLDGAGLAKGAQFLFNPATGSRDLVTNKEWTRGGSISVIATPQGKVFNFDGSGDYLEFTGYPQINTGVGTFAAWFPRVGAPASFGHIYMVEGTGGVYHQVEAGEGVYFGGSLGSGVISGWFNSVKRSLVLTTTGTAAGTKCYIDGKDSGLTWASPPSAWPAGSKTLRIGNYAGGAVWDTDASMLSIVQASRYWGPSEAKIFHESQGRALFKAQPKRIRIAIAAAIGGGSTVFRSTLSAMGTRSGSRQVHR